MLTQNERVKTPDKLLANMQIARLGKITFVLQFISLAIMFLGIISFSLVLAYYMVLCVIALFTLFLILFDPEFLALFSAGEGVWQFSMIIASWWKFTAPITACISALSIVCLCLDKSKKNTAKIIISAVVAAFALIYLFSFIVELGARS